MFEAKREGERARFIPIFRHLFEIYNQRDRNFQMSAITFLPSLSPLPAFIPFVNVFIKFEGNGGSACTTAGTCLSSIKESEIASKLIFITPVFLVPCELLSFNSVVDYRLLIFSGKVTKEKIMNLILIGSIISI